jgi:hypothetical protein
VNSLLIAAKDAIWEALIRSVSHCALAANIRKPDKLGSKTRSAFGRWVLFSEIQ